MCFLTDRRNCYDTRVTRLFLRNYRKAFNDNNNEFTSFENRRRIPQRINIINNKISTKIFFCLNKKINTFWKTWNKVYVKLSPHRSTDFWFIRDNLFFPIIPCTILIFNYMGIRHALNANGCPNFNNLQLIVGRTKRVGMLSNLYYMKLTVSSISMLYRTRAQSRKVEN